MENGLFSVLMESVRKNSVVMDGIANRTRTVVRDDSGDGNGQQHSFGGCTFVSALQGGPASDVDSDTLMMQHNTAVVPEVPGISIASVERSFARSAYAGNPCPLDNSAFQEQVLGGTSISNAVVIQENLNNFAAPGSVFHPFELLHACMPDDALNSCDTPPMNYWSKDACSSANDKGSLDSFLFVPELTGKVEIQPFSCMRNQDSAAWILPVDKNMTADNPYNAYGFTNELSLSLASSSPSVLDDRSILDRRSDISFSHTPSNQGGSEQASCTSKELSLSCGYDGAGRYSQAICGSKYLRIMQEILYEIANFSTQSMEQTMTTANASFSSFYPAVGAMRLMDSDESDNLDSSIEIPLETTQHKRALERRKMQLLSLLQVVDDRYNQCVDEMHTVISAFHAATELDPQIHMRFVRQTISFLYKGLRARISNQILSMGALYDSRCAKEMEKSTAASCLHERWNLQQQLTKKDHQVWRPQRGLPERSVSVLRAWMFQNFLHPYPKDAEKHLLAIKSGLTRSQVSNWFINARVRLWKPMIEEMYAEMNGRKTRRSHEEATASNRSPISMIRDQRF